MAQEVTVSSFVNDIGEGRVYNADVNFKQFQASGLMVVNQTALGTRIDLLSKVGNTLLSFTLTPEKVIWERFFLDIKPKRHHKKGVEKSFRMMLLMDLAEAKTVVPNKKNVFKVKGKLSGKYTLDESHSHVIYAKQKCWLNLFRRKVALVYIGDKPLPVSIELTHGIFNFDINLNLLD
jgi:hypothetical protein